MQDPTNQPRQSVPVKLVLPRWLVRGLVIFKKPSRANTDEGQLKTIAVQTSKYLDFQVRKSPAVLLLSERLILLYFDLRVLLESCAATSTLPPSASTLRPRPVPRPQADALRLPDASSLPSPRPVWSPLEIHY
jgi:hypothetical protein